MCDCRCVSGVGVPECVAGLAGLQSEARYVLVVEKDATFQKLLESHFLRSFGPAIMVTVRRREEGGRRGREGRREGKREGRRRGGKEGEGEEGRKRNRRGKESEGEKERERRGKERKGGKEEGRKGKEEVKRNEREGGK